MRARNSFFLNAHKGAPSTKSNVSASWICGHVSSILVRYLLSSKEIEPSLDDGVMTSTPTRAFFADETSVGGGAVAVDVSAAALARLPIVVTRSNCCERQWHRDYAVTQAAME